MMSALSRFAGKMWFRQSRCFGSEFRRFRPARPESYYPVVVVETVESSAIQGAGVYVNLQGNHVQGQDTYKHVPTPRARFNNSRFPGQSRKAPRRIGQLPGLTGEVSHCVPVSGLVLAEKQRSRLALVTQRAAVEAVTSDEQTIR